MYVNPWYYYENNIFIKKKKPCMPGNQVHIKSWQGCYNVITVKTTHFTIMKNRVEYIIPWEEFVCLKGKGRSAEALLKKDVRSSLYLIDMLSTNLNGVLQDLRK